MTPAEKRYPDWVQEQRTRGTTVKRKGIPIISISGHPGASPEEIPPAGRYLYWYHHTGRGHKKRKEKNIPGRDRSEGIRIFPGSMAALPPGVEKAPGRRLGGCPFHHPVEVVAGNLPYERKEAEAGTGFPLSV